MCICGIFEYMYTSVLIAGRSEWLVVAIYTGTYIILLETLILPGSCYNAPHTPGHLRYEHSGVLLKRLFLCLCLFVNGLKNEVKQTLVGCCCGSTECGVLIATI